MEFNKRACAIAVSLWIGAALVLSHVEGHWLSAIGLGPILYAAVSAGNGFARGRYPYSPPTLDLNRLDRSAPPVDPGEVMRRLALRRFRAWHPGPDVTIH
jgi:hypothetical protein